MKPRYPSAYFKLSATIGLSIFGGLAFFVVLALTLRDPTVEFGRAIGLKNLLVVVANCFVAAVASSLGIKFLLAAKSWSPKTALLFLVLTLVTSSALSDILLRKTNERFSLAMSVMEAKVLYHCKTRYNPGRCVDQLDICPQCKSVFSPAERKDLHAKLMLFQEKLDESLRQAELAREKSGPLSEAVEDWRKRQARTPASETSP